MKRSLRGKKTPHLTTNLAVPSLLLLLFVVTLIPSVSALNTDNIVLYHSFDDIDISGSTIDDLSGITGASTIGASVNTGDAGILAEAFNFSDGNNAYVNSTSLGSSFWTGDHSSSYWIYINQDSGTEQYANYLAGDLRYTYSGYDINQCTVTNEIVYLIRDSSNVWHCTTSGAVSLKTWYHVVTVFDAGGAGMQLWVNAVNVDNNSQNINDKVLANDPVIGNYRQIGTQPWGIEGYIDEFAMFNTTLTEADIDELYNAGAGYNPFTVAGNVSYPYAHVKVKDEVSGDNLEGITVHVGLNTNTTGASGVAYFYNNSYTNISIDSPWEKYDDMTATATQNTTTIINLTRTPWVYINTTDAYNNSPIEGVNVSYGTKSNVSDTNGVAYVYNLSTLSYVATKAFRNPVTGTSGAYNETTNISMNSTFATITLTPPNGEASLANNLTITCGNTINNYNNAIDGDTYIVGFNTSCSLNITYATYYSPTITNITTTYLGTNTPDVSPTANAYFTFTGDISGDTYTPTCLNSTSNQLSHINTPYYLIINAATNYTCADTLLHTALTMTLNNTRVLNQSFTLTEYKLSLNFTQATNGDIYWGSSVITETIGSGYFNWTNTTLIKKITEFCPESNNDCKVTVQFEKNTSYPQYYEFYSTLGETFTQDLYVIPNKNTFGVWQVLSSGGNALKDARIYQGIKSGDNTGAELLYLNVSNVRYTDSEGITTLNFNDDNFMSLLVTKEGYAPTIYTYHASEVANTTYANPIIINLETQTTVGTLDTYIWCNDFVHDEGDEIYCYITTPYASYVTWNTENNISHTAALNGAQVALITLEKCTSQAEFDAGECDYFNNTAMNLTVSDGTNTYKWPIGLNVFTQEENILRGWMIPMMGNSNQTDVEFLYFPNVEEGILNGLLFLVLVIISILMGVYFNLPNGDAGFHTFHIGLIFLSAITGTFLVATSVSLLYYVARGLHLSGEQ